LRTATQGQAFCLQIFDHWSIVPVSGVAGKPSGLGWLTWDADFCVVGDPTDASVLLRRWSRRGAALARDLVLKTRRRKGLGDRSPCPSTWTTSLLCVFSPPLVWAALIFSFFLARALCIRSR